MVYFLLTLNFLLMIIMPVLLGMWIARRYKVRWSLFFLGAIGFVLAQVLHIPFNRFVLNPIVESINIPEGIILSLVTAVLFGLSAGVFEEVVRYLFYFVRKTMRGFDQGLMFGAGWGGIESIIAGMLAAISVVNIYIYQSGLIETMLPADQLANSAEAIAAAAGQIEELVNSPPYVFILGAVERAFALVLHLSLSILVLQAVVRKNILWLFAAIGWHTTVNAVAVFGALQGWDVLLIEAAVGVFAVLSLLIIRALKPADEMPAVLEEE